MAIKLILGCVITLLLCGTTYYFFSWTVVTTSAFSTGLQDTFNSLASNVISNSIPPNIEFVLNSGLIIRIVNKHGTYYLEYLEVDGSDFLDIEKFMQFHGKLLKVMKQTVAAISTDPSIIAAKQAELELL